MQKKQVDVLQTLLFHFWHKLTHLPLNWNRKFRQTFKFIRTHTTPSHRGVSFRCRSIDYSTTRSFIVSAASVYLRAGRRQKSLLRILSHSRLQPNMMFRRLIEWTTDGINGNILIDCVRMWTLFALFSSLSNHAQTNRYHMCAHFGILHVMCVWLFAITNPEHFFTFCTWNCNRKCFSTRLFSIKQPLAHRQTCWRDRRTVADT